MRRTRWSRLLLAAAAVTAVVLAVLRLVESRGGTILPVPLLVTVVLLGIAAVVLGAGWQVRQMREGRRPGMDPLLAARTVVLATSAAWAGALLSGWYAAHVLVALGELHVEARRDVVVSGAAALACTVLLSVAGLVAERWCELRQDDDDDPAAGASAGSTA
jgi:hypothetical protein